MNEPKRYSARQLIRYTGIPDENRTQFIHVDDPAYQEMQRKAENHDEILAMRNEELDELWQIIYPGKTDWGYPAQVVRHVRDAYQEMQRKAEAFEMLEELFVAYGRIGLTAYADCITADCYAAWDDVQASTLEAAIRAAHAAMRGER